MFETFVKAFVDTLTVYAAAGFAFALPFVFWGVQRLDSEAQGVGIGFRLLITPGVAALWPLFLARLMCGVPEPPLERNPHR